jgi:hypothetical protein
VLTNQQVLHPHLAEAILDTFLPAPAPEPVISDPRPAIAENIRMAVNRAAAGDPTSAMAFAAAGQDAASSIASPFARAMLRGMGPLQSVDLLQIGPDGERRYRLGFQFKSVVWRASADSDARLTRFRPE